MIDLLKEFEECSGEIIEVELGRKAVLIDPDGEKYEKSALDPLENLKSTGPLPVGLSGEKSTLPLFLQRIYATCQKKV